MRRFFTVYVNEPTFPSNIYQCMVIVPLRSRDRGRLLENGDIVSQTGILWSTGQTTDSIWVSQNHHLLLGADQFEMQFVQIP